ncbi:sulfotransferase domain-containing protein [Lacibacterium aquatile]|uniref:Sulfotransferase domain-containing protein n=1 Tax=Lacibacterium aquatile TaxID=1168082 RepID=A0ABW5DW46_9PROT
MSGFFWLASYPKSGNTWLRLALLCLKQGKPMDFASRPSFAPIAANRHAFDVSLGVASSDLTPAEIAILRPRSYEEQARDTREPLFCKVHDAWQITPAGEPLFPPAVTLGSLHIVRDPRDVAISWAHHAGITVDAAITHLSNPQASLAQQSNKLADQLPQHLGSWSEHVASWLDAPGIQPSLLVRYEDMHTDAPSELRRVVDYIGWSAPPTAITEALAATRFDRLRAAEDDKGFLERPKTAERFFRQGRAGGWRSVLTSEQAMLIEENHGPMMRRLGYL